MISYINFTELLMDCMHACNGQYVMTYAIPYLPNCAIENPGNSQIRDKYKTHDHIHPSLNHYSMKR
jgi:hypothetical protein